jgi:hypothetical protein
VVTRPVVKMESLSDEAATAALERRRWRREGSGERDEGVEVEAFLEVAWR